MTKEELIKQLEQLGFNLLTPGQHKDSRSGALLHAWAPNVTWYKSRGKFGVFVNILKKPGQEAYSRSTLVIINPGNKEISNYDEVIPAIVISLLEDKEL